LVSPTTKPNTDDDGTDSRHEEHTKDSRIHEQFLQMNLTHKAQITASITA
jgi:hypothetical protein